MIIFKFAKKNRDLSLLVGANPRGKMLSSPMETVFRAAPTRTPDPPFSTAKSGGCYSLSVIEHLRKLNIAAQITTQIKLNVFFRDLCDNENLKTANSCLKFTETKKFYKNIRVAALWRDTTSRNSVSDPYVFGPPKSGSTDPDPAPDPDPALDPDPAIKKQK